MASKIPKNTATLENIEKTGLGVFLSTDDNQSIYDDNDNSYIMISFGEGLNRTLKNSATLTSVSKNTATLTKINKNTATLKNISKTKYV